MTPGTAVWFARHESRLAWRDWLSMITAGRRERLRRVVIAILVFAVFMHFVAYWMVGRYADAPVDTSMLVTITASVLLSWLLMISQAMESMTRAFYSRSDLDLILASPVAAQRLFRRAHRHDCGLGRDDGDPARRAVHRYSDRTRRPALDGRLRADRGDGRCGGRARGRLHGGAVPHHRSQAHAPCGASRCRRDRRRLRDRAASRGDLVLRHDLTDQRVAVQRRAGARARSRQHCLVAGARRDGRLACAHRRARREFCAACCRHRAGLAALRRICRRGCRCRSVERQSDRAAERIQKNVAAPRLAPQGMDAAAARSVAGVADFHADALSDPARRAAVAQF